MSFLIDSILMVISQLLFFGFGWLFFMRQLFKDYEVSIGCIFHALLVPEDAPNAGPEAQ